MTSQGRPRPLRSLAFYVCQPILPGYHSWQLGQEHTVMRSGSVDMKQESVRLLGSLSVRSCPQVSSRPYPAEYNRRDGLLCSQVLHERVVTLRIVARYCQTQTNKSRIQISRGNLLRLRHGLVDLTTAHCLFPTPRCEQSGSCCGRSCCISIYSS